MKSSIKRMTPERALDFIKPSVEKARACLECAECVARCPYHLEIPTLLKEWIKYWDSLESA